MGIQKMCSHQQHDRKETSDININININMSISITRIISKKKKKKSKQRMKFEMNELKKREKSVQGSIKIISNESSHLQPARNKRSRPVAKNQLQILRFSDSL